MKRLAFMLPLVMVVGLVVSAEAQVTCTPRFGGGYNCSDNQGNTTTTTPRFGGGSNTYDNQGNTTTCTPRFGGGFTCN